MNSFPATSAATPAFGFAPTAATSGQGHKQVGAPSPQESSSSTSRDFFLDTFCNPLWTDNSNVFPFSFDEKGNVVRPKNSGSMLYGPETRETAAQHWCRVSKKPWKHVDISEYDMEDEAFRMTKRDERIKAIGEWEDRMMKQYGPGWQPYPNGFYPNGYYPPTIPQHWQGQPEWPYPTPPHFMQ